MTHYPRLCFVTLGMFLFSGGFAQSESLKEAIDQVMKTNPQVRAQAYNRLARDQEKRQAVSGYYPTLDVTAGSGYSEHSEPISETLYPNEAKISLKQNVFSGFGTVLVVSSGIPANAFKSAPAVYTVPLAWITTTQISLL